MRLRDLPLAFLPTFEAAGRLGGFAAAAAELHLTPSAVSQQIRALEDTLGVALFERAGRAARLTPDGARYLCEVRQALQELSFATARLQRRARGSTLQLSTAAIAAHEFVLPRMAAFQAHFPELALSVESSSELIDFRTSDCDAAIRVGVGWPDLEVHPLGQLVFAPVCASALAAQIHSVADLTRCTLLDPDGSAEQLLALLQQQTGSPQLRAARTLRFETCFEAIRAAELGLGVAFGMFPVLTSWVSSGRLAVPLAERLELPGTVSFVHRHLDTERFPFPAIAAFWAAEFQALPALPHGRIASP